MTTSIIIAIVVCVIVIFSGGALIVSLSAPLTSLKDLLVGVIDLICNNAIWFLLFMLIFVMAIVFFKKLSLKTSDKTLNERRLERERFEFEKQKHADYMANNNYTLKRMQQMENERKGGKHYE